MNIVSFLLSLISLLAVASASPAINPRQTGISFSFAPLPPPPTPTACPPYATPITTTWLPAATNVAAIPKGVLTPCQLNCLGTLECDTGAYQWTSCFQKPNISSIRSCLCLSVDFYQSKFNLCARCLADAQFLANKANLPAHPDPDFFDYNNGLVMQLNNAFVDGCYEPGNFGPLDNSPETLAHYLCVTREITERFGGPIAMMNFTLKDYPSLAWDGVHPTSTLPFGGT